MSKKKQQKYEQGFRDGVESGREERDQLQAENTRLREACEAAYSFIVTGGRRGEKLLRIKTAVLTWGGIQFEENTNE